MPSLDDIKAVTYPDPLLQFTTMTESVGGHVVEVKEGQDINQMIKELYPDAKEIASNLPEITIATRNPDTIPMLASSAESSAWQRTPASGFPSR